LRPGNGHPAALDRSVKIYVAGMQDPRRYYIAESERDRILAILEKPGILKDGVRRFMVFTTFDGHIEVAIRLQYIQAIRFLWDVPSPLTEEPTTAPVDTLKLYLKDREEAFEFHAEDPAQVVAFVTCLQAGLLLPHSLYTFLDAEDGYTTICLNEVVLIEIAGEFLQEGRRKEKRD
jgi:hypothetical protein